MGKDSLSITDNRTGKSYEIAVKDGAVRTADLRQIKTDADDFGLLGYDPAFLNTASCRSAITFIDGDKGILRYRGYDVAELAEHSTFLETAYLIFNGELPSHDELEKFTNEITMHTFLHENVRSFMDGFRYDAHPMGVLIGTVGGLSTFYPEAKEVRDPAKASQARSRASSRRCRRSPRGRTVTRSASRSSIPTTRSASRATCSR